MTQRVTQKQLLSQAKVLARHFGLSRDMPVAIYPNGVGNGWDIVYDRQDGSIAPQKLLMSFRGTTTEVYREMQVAIDTLQRLQAIREVEQLQ